MGRKFIIKSFISFLYALKKLNLPHVRYMSYVICMRYVSCLSYASCMKYVGDMNYVNYMSYVSYMRYVFRCLMNYSKSPKIP